MWRPRKLLEKVRIVANICLYMWLRGSRLNVRSLSSHVFRKSNKLVLLRYSINSKYACPYCVFPLKPTCFCWDGECSYWILSMIHNKLMFEIQDFLFPGFCIISTRPLTENSLWKQVSPGLFWNINGTWMCSPCRVPLNEHNTEKHILSRCTNRCWSKKKKETWEVSKIIFGASGLTDFWNSKTARTSYYCEKHSSDSFSIFGSKILSGGGRRIN